jgi:hypothetical protein
MTIRHFAHRAKRDSNKSNVNSASTQFERSCIGTELHDNSFIGLQLLTVTKNVVVALIQANYKFAKHFIILCVKVDKSNETFRLLCTP